MPPSPAADARPPATTAASAGRGPGPGGESIGALISRLRTATGRSQLRVAELLCAASGSPTVTRHEISRWEREERIPSPHWLAWLAVVLDTSLDELERAAELARARRTGGDGEDRLRDLHRMDDLVGGADLVRVVAPEQRAALRALADADGAGSRRRRAAHAAELAQLAGWVAADAGDRRAALRAHRLGVRAADAAGDDVLAGVLLASAAHLGLAGEPGRGLRLARAGQERARRRAGPALRCLLLHRVAYAAARAGERRLCERSLGAAEREFDRADPGVPEPHAYWLGAAELTAMAGRCYAALGRPRLAAPLLWQGLDGGLRLRPWALYAGWLAAAELSLGRVDAACDLAGRALLTAVRVGSVRARGRVAALHPRLAPLAGRPEVRRYAGLLRAVRPYLPAEGGRTARAASR